MNVESLRIPSADRALPRSTSSGTGKGPSPLAFTRSLAVSAAVAIAYAAAAAVGFRLAFVAEQVTTVWAPTGIALAALLIGGLRLWPAVWVGALFANLGTGAPVWTAFVIATGNTLEATTAVWCLNRIPGFECSLRRIADVLAFVIIAALACTAISATVGVAALCLAAVQPWDRFGVLWFDWWLGDALGAIVVAPALLSALRRPWTKRKVVRSLLWIAGSVLVTYAVFGQPAGASAHPFEYLVFPLVIAAAVTGGPALTSWVVLTASVVAIWHTVNGAGPFATPVVHDSLILLQAFMGVLAGTALLLAAAVAERITTERRERDHAAELERVLESRVKAETALRESRDVLTLAMRGGSMGAWSRNLVTNDVWWSGELEDLFGLQPGEFNRKESGFFEFVHEDERGAVRAAVDQAVQNGSDYIVEFRFRHANGEWRWMEGRGRAEYGEDGTPRNLYGIGIDVTDRKRSEIALREAKLAAESANQLKDEFLATLSHELRTPLNAILGYARMLQTNSIAPDKRPRAIDVIERNAVAQNRLVEDLLDMSRITTGKVRLDPTPVPVVAVLREAVEGVRPAADAKGIALVTDFDPFAGSVRADTTRLQQVFWNLLTNAVKFTNDGGRVVASLHRKDAHVEIAVADTGAGISPEFLPFVFEPFRQADNRFDRTHAGLGLGLAITRQLVELHGGTLDASSPGIDQGATFTVTLPRIAGPDADAAEAAATSRSPSAQHPVLRPSLAGLKILLVDDEEDTLTMFRDALENAEAEVRAVSSGRAALQVAEEWRPDLLVADLGLPGMDGYELLTAIRARYAPDECPVVAVSAYARLDDRTRALAAGFQAHVTKPIDPAALVLVLRSALRPTE